MQTKDVTLFLHHRTLGGTKIAGYGMRVFALFSRF